MWAALEASRACATVWNPVPAATLIQKLVELSTSGAGRPFASAWNCCAALLSSRPKEPVCAAPAMTLAVPLPSSPSQALRFPDSKPLENATLVYAGLGATADEGAESAPVPTELVAATLNVYAVPFVRPVIVRVVLAVPVLIGVCAFAPM